MGDESMNTIASVLFIIPDVLIFLSILSSFCLGVIYTLCILIFSPICLDVVRWDVTKLPLRTASIDVCITDLVRGGHSSITQTTTSITRYNNLYKIFAGRLCGFFDEIKSTVIYFKMMF